MFFNRYVLCMQAQIVPTMSFIAHVVSLGLSMGWCWRATSPSSDTYRGPYAASKPEVCQLASYINGLSNVCGYIDWHSYGQVHFILTFAINFIGSRSPFHVNCTLRCVDEKRGRPQIWCNFFDCDPLSVHMSESLRFISSTM